MYPMFWFGLMLAALALVVMLLKGGLSGPSGTEGGFIASDEHASHGDSDGGGDGCGD
ncbi:MAG: hypothetical protein ABIO61_01615 [Thermomonas sp.]